MKNKIGSQGFVRGLLILLIVIGLIAAGIAFAKPYYRYYTLSSNTRDILRLEIGNTKSIKERIMAEANELKIPLDEKNLDVSISNNKITKVKATWSDIFDLWGYYQKKIDFVMEEEL